MVTDTNLFKEPEPKTEIITIRLTKRQKERLNQMAGHRGVSNFILTLIDQENERQINGRVIDLYEDDDVVVDDGMPF